jgi:hypothetical protein
MRLLDVPTMVIADNAFSAGFAGTFSAAASAASCA